MGQLLLRDSLGFSPSSPEHRLLFNYVLNYPQIFPSQIAYHFGLLYSESEKQIAGNDLYPAEIRLIEQIPYDTHEK